MEVGTLGVASSERSWIATWSSPPPPSPPPESPRSRSVGRFGVRRFVRLALRLQMPPVRDDVGPISVDFEPGERFLERCPMQQAALRPERRVDVEHSGHQREDLLKPLDIAPGNGQQPELDPAFHRVGVEPWPSSAHEAERVE